MMTGNPAGVRVLHKMLDILEALKKEAAGAGLAQISREIKLPKPTVYRILATLESRGYVDRDAGGGYRVSRKLHQFGGDGSPEKALLDAARPVMQELVAACKETVNLGVLDGGDVVVIETVESPQAVRMSSKVGNRRYLHTTALGKALLAGLPEKEVLRLVSTKGLPPLTTSTITDRSELLAEIGRVRQRGYAMDNLENEPDGRCIGAPIMDHHDRTVGALSISGPVPRMSMARARALIKDLQKAARAISLALQR